MIDRQYTAQVRGRTGWLLYQSQPHATREDAAREAFEKWPAAKTCSTGYGYAGGFDIRWHRRSDAEATP